MLIRIIITIILVLFVRKKFLKKNKIRSPKSTHKNDDIVDAEYTVINDD